MSEFTERVLKPVSIPLAAAGFVGVLVFAFSRILLAVPEMGSTSIALLISMEILGVTAVLAAGTHMKRAQKAILALTGFALIVGGGTSAAIGVREIEAHHAEFSLVASGIKFTQTEIELPVGEAFKLEFKNLDSGVPHNVSFYSGDQPLFQGEVFNGVATKEYEVGAMSKGTYTFVCDVHPDQMRGDAVVGGGGTPPPHATQSPSPSPASTVSPTPSPTGEAPVTLTIVAKNIKFDKAELILKAKEEVEIVFDNQDAGIPHNVSIYTDRSANKEVFREEPFNGPKEVEYRFTSPAAGTYYFHCDVHPNMNGTVIFR